MDFQICNMPQVLFPFAFIAGMWLWDTVLSKIFAEGLTHTFRHFRFLVRNSFRLPPFVGLGYFCRLPYPGHRPAVVRPLLRLVIPAAARLPFRVSSRPVITLVPIFVLVRAPNRRDAVP